jgi:hypothetical protein
MTAATDHTSLGLEKNIFSAYCGLLALIFIFKPTIPLAGTFPALEAGSKAYDITHLFCQVVGFLMAQIMLVQCPGPRGLQMAMIAMMAGMAYHIHVLGVVPPIPVMSGVAIVLGSTFFSGLASKDKHDSKVSQVLFILWNLVQGAIFVATRKSGTGTPGISDTYPDIDLKLAGALATTNVRGGSARARVCVCVCVWMRGWVGGAVRRGLRG